MRTRCLIMACLVLLGAAGSLWAASFTEVASGHWTYAACRYLAAMNLLPAASATGFSGDPALTRFEFGTAILDPLTKLDTAMRSLPPGADSHDVVNATARALGISPRASEQDVARASEDLTRLSREFDDVLHSLNFDPALAGRALEALANPEAVRKWRAEALQSPGPSTAGIALLPAGDLLEVPLAHGTFALTLNQGVRPPGLLDYLALSAAGSARGDLEATTTADPALRDPRVSRLRTAYEYGIGSAITLSLAYEEIARQGQGLSPLDAASLASVGLGYRLTSSTSVRLSYSLLEYSNYVFDSPPVRDRVAETAVSIEF